MLVAVAQSALAMVKPAAAYGKEITRGNDARQRARQRDHDHFGDQIGGLHPGDLVRAGGEASLDLRE
jgi:hypothetical protein